MSLLKADFFRLISLYSNNNSIAESYWKEIEEAYSRRTRHYHNLLHLENLYREISSVKAEFKNWNTILFALYYHDFVYDASGNDNEESSANLVKERLKQISFPSDQIEKCERIILATKGHSVNDDSDINFFTDADLSILGTNWEAYSEYARNVRKEYSIYPDFLYNPGRKKSLTTFSEYGPDL